MAVLDRVSIHGYRGARDVELAPGAVCVLVGESSSGKSTVLAAVWTLLEAAAPMPTVADVSHGYTRIHDTLQQMENDYIRTEGNNAAVWGLKA